LKQFGSKSGLRIKEQTEYRSGVAKIAAFNVMSLPEHSNSVISH